MEILKLLILTINVESKLPFLFFNFLKNSLKIVTWNVKVFQRRNDTVNCALIKIERIRWTCAVAVVADSDWFYTIFRLLFFQSFQLNEVQSPPVLWYFTTSAEHRTPIDALLFRTIAYFGELHFYYVTPTAIVLLEFPSEVVNVTDSSFFFVYNTISVPTVPSLSRTCVLSICIIYFNSMRMNYNT